MSCDPPPIRVLAVDDHQLIGVGIAALPLPESDMKLGGVQRPDVRDFNRRKGFI